MINNSQSVITFATNKYSYVKLALNCAQSVLMHNDIRVFIVSNMEIKIPADLINRLFIIPPKPGHAALGIGMKLYIDEYLQTEHTLFIDSDCICFGSLDPIFTACEGMNVSVAGNIVPAASWCGIEQANTIKQHFGLDKLIRFNGGLYYLKNSALTKSIFNKAREIAWEYDSYGFRRIDNKWINEEGPLSIAMMLNEQQPIADDGQFMTDLYTDPRPDLLNVLDGARSLKNPSDGLPRHRSWYPKVYRPIIIHFGGSNLGSYPYNSQNLLLVLISKGLSGSIARLLVQSFIHFPYKTFHWLKSFNKG